MTRKEAINDLKTLKDFFIEQSDATPLCLDYVIEALECKHGEWITVKGSNGKDYRKCTNCLHTQEITGLLNYCPVCGSDMRERRSDGNNC